MTIKTTLLLKEIEDEADFNILEYSNVHDLPKSLPARMTKGEMQFHYELLYEAVTEAQKQVDAIAQRVYRYNLTGHVDV